jgi:hypothetical protein
MLSYDLTSSGGVVGPDTTMEDQPPSLELANSATITIRGLRVAILGRRAIGVSAARPELEFHSPHLQSPVDALNFEFGGMVPR